MIGVREIPQDSEISKYLVGAHLYDAFEVPVAGSGRSALQIYIDLMSATPGWVNGLLEARDRFVGIFGLKNLGHLDNIDPSRPVESYRPGDHLGIFSILSISDREVILLETDKHLEAKVSLFKTGEGESGAAVFSTVIHIRNLLGRAYMVFVWPLHKLIVPALLARSIAGGEGRASIRNT